MGGPREGLIWGGPGGAFLWGVPGGALIWGGGRGGGRSLEAQQTKTFIRRHEWRWLWVGVAAERGAI